MPRDEVRRPDDLAEPVGDRPQQVVAGRVPEAVVDRLEVVEIEVEQGRQPSRFRALRALARVGFGSESCERVRIREPLELVARLAFRGDVEQIALPLDRVAVRIGDRRRLVADPDNPAVRADDAVLAADRPVLRRLVCHLAEDAVAVVRVQDSPEERRAALPLVGRVAEHRLGLRARVDVRAVGVGFVDVDDERELLDERAVARFGGAQPLLRRLPFADVADARGEEWPFGQVDPVDRDLGIELASVRA